MGKRTGAKEGIGEAWREGVMVRGQWGEMVWVGPVVEQAESTETVGESLSVS